ncbi:hypothetical protein [Prosthecobacter sp.]|uniref:hypothetical protein n=1 Tax=Prosthecobacter sp. TaxID=1965333 RepID=UPI003904CD60
MIKSLVWPFSTGVLLLTFLSACVTAPNSLISSPGSWSPTATPNPALSQHMSQVRKAQYEMKLMVSTIKSRNDLPVNFSNDSQTLYDQARFKWQTAGQAVASDYVAGMAALSPSAESAMQSAQQSQDDFRTHYNSLSDHRDLTDYVKNLGILLVSDLFNTGRGYVQQQQREMMAQSIANEFLLPSWQEIPPAMVPGTPVAYPPAHVPLYPAPATPYPANPQQL